MATKKNEIVEVALRNKGQRGPGKRVAFAPVDDAAKIQEDLSAEVGEDQEVFVRDQPIQVMTYADWKNRHEEESRLNEVRQSALSKLSDEEKAALFGITAKETETETEKASA